MKVVFSSSRVGVLAALFGLVFHHNVTQTKLIKHMRRHDPILQFLLKYCFIKIYILSFHLFN